jgi:hypothetical protein
MASPCCLRGVVISDTDEAMRRFIPSRLIAVRHYMAMSYTSPGADAPPEQDCRVLRTHGIEAYVKGMRRVGVALMVPEHQYEKAKEVLSSVPELFAPHDIAPKCPNCHSEHPYARVPYAFLLLVAGMTAAGVAIAYGYSNTSGIIAVLTAVIATMLQVTIPHWQCRSCGKLYGTMSEPQR